MKKKKLAVLATSLGLAAALSLPNVSYARDTNYTNGASFSWSPYTWSRSAFKWSNEITGDFSNVKFSSNAANQHNSLYYLTFEINNTRDHVGHTGWYWTNLPDPGFDRDDDDNDGRSEEAEAYIEADGWKQSISANYGYGFQTSWWYASSGNFDFIVQRSLWNPFNGEMEGYHYDKITNYSWNHAYALGSLSEKASNKIQTDHGKKVDKEVIFTDNSMNIVSVKEADSKEKEIYVQPNVSTKAEFNKYKSKQKEMLKEIKNDDIEVVLTFNKPLSVQKLKQLVNKYKIDVSSYEIKAADKDGAWTTVGGTPDKQELFPQKRYNGVTKNRDLKFSGFTSLVGTVNKQKLASLEKDQDIFLADVSKEYVKSLNSLSAQSENTNIDIQVPDFAWEVNELK